MQPATDHFAQRRFARSRAFAKGDLGAVALLGAIFFGVNWRLLIGQVSEQWDGEMFFAPWYTFIARLARSGHLLMWNPLSGGGSPDFAEPQLGACSPITLLFALIAGPGPTAYHLYWLILWFAGGLGMYVLARAQSAPPWGALLTSLGFVFSGFYLGHAEHTSFIYVFAFVPWTIWRLQVALTAGRRWAAVEAGALWGVSALAGNPAAHIPAGLFAGMIALAWAPARPGLGWHARGREYAVAMFLLTVVGIAVLAPTYVSFRHEVLGYSNRSLPLSLAVALPSDSPGFNWLTAMASPMIPVGTYHSPGWPQIDICYLPIYFGATLSVLAAFALGQGRSRWWTWIVAATGLLFLGFSFGSTLPLRGWLFDLAPPTRFFRHASTFRGFFIVAVAMLAASATAIVEERRRAPETAGNRLKSLASIALALAAVSVAAFVWVFTSLPRILDARMLPWASLHLGIAWVGLAALCWLAVRSAQARRWLPGALVALTALDLTGAYLLTARVIYKPTASPALVEPTLPFPDLGAAGFARGLAAPGNTNLYRQEPVFANYTAMLNPVHEKWVREPLLLQAAAGAQRVWFAAEAPTVPATPKAFAAFLRRVHELGNLVVLRTTRAALIDSDPTEAPAMLNAIAAAAPAERVPCVVRSYRADDLSLSVTCPRAGFVLLTERWSRSWQATVNGRPTPVEGGDFIFRLVPVAEGVNLIEMKFRPPWLWPLLTLSWTTLAVVGLAAVWRWRQRSKIPAGPAPLAPGAHGT